MAGPWAMKALNFPMIGMGRHVKGAEKKLSGAHVEAERAGK